MRYKVVVSYDGHRYEGFQVQNKKLTIQGEIERVLKVVNKQEIRIQASGRTDSKVHALGQVFHFDSELDIDWKYVFNNMLPNDIYVIEADKVNDQFHARYDVVKKSYKYIINTGSYNLFENNYVLQYNRKLDVEKMIDASKLFIGKHNFKQFCGVYKEYNDFVRIIYSIDFEIENNKIIINFMGNGFLRYMVRGIVGALMEVGKNRITIEDISLMLNNEKKCPYRVKGNGLYLVEVFYE